MPLTMPKIFISYRREGGAHLARYLHDKLTDMGMDAFIDVDDLPIGKFSREIEKEIIHRKFFVVILTPTTLESEWVRKEIKIALAHDRSIIPLITRDFKFDEHVPDDVAQLREFNAIEYDFRNPDVALRKLEANILKEHETSQTREQTTPPSTITENQSRNLETAMPDGDMLSSEHEKTSQRPDKPWWQKPEFVIGVIMIPIIVALIPVIFDNKGNVITPTQTESPTQLAQSVTDTPTPSVTTDIALTPTLTFTPEVTPPSQTATDESTLAPNGINLESELTEASLLAWWTSNGCTPLVSNEILDNLARGHMTDLRRRDFIELTSEPTLAYLSSANQTIQQVATIFSPPYRQPLSLVVLIKQDIINVGDFVDELGLVVGGAINCNYTQYGISHESSLVSGHHYFVVLLGMSN